MNKLSISTKFSSNTVCEICSRTQKLLLISGVKLCGGCKTAYYRHSQKLLIYLLSNDFDPNASENKPTKINNWSDVTDLIHKFLTENYSCDRFEQYINSTNCTTIGNLTCKACKLVKIILNLRKLPSNLDQFGWDIQVLINTNRERIFDVLMQRFEGYAVKSETTSEVDVSTVSLPISPENTLPQPNIHLSVIDYICQSLHNSDEHFIFQNERNEEPLISLDKLSFHTGDRRSQDPHSGA